MSEPVEVLRSILREARAAAWRRLLLRVLVDAGLGTVAITTIAALCAGLTLRGDLTAIGWAGLVGAGTVALLVGAVLEARRYGSDLRVARGVAAHSAPLGRSVSPARR